MRSKFNLLLAGLMAFSLGLTGCVSDNGASSSLGTRSGTLAVEEAVASGDTSSIALTLSDKLSVVEANTASSSASSNVRVQALNLDFDRLMAVINADNFSEGTDYVKDETSFFVHERAAEGMDQVNSILCSINQSKFSQFVNQGAYKAQVDDSQCETQGSSGGSESDSSGSNSVSYSYWTVEATRTDLNSPQIIKFWIDDSNSGEGSFIHAKMTITEGSSDSNDLGIFRMDFIGYSAKNGIVDTSKELMRGFMQTTYNSAGQVVLDFVNRQSMNGQPITPSTPGDQIMTFDISFIRSSDGNSGQGSATVPGFDRNRNALVNTDFNFAYDSNYFYRGESFQGVEEKVCLDRNDFHEVAWRYGLYDKNGARVNRKSGFPIKYSGSTREYQGYIGYYGLWMPSEAGVGNGSTVSKLEWVDGKQVTTDYKVIQLKGKLFKHTRKELTLGDIVNIPLNYSEFTTSGFTDYRVVFDGTNLVKQATRSSSSNWQWQKLTTSSNVTFTANDYSAWFWSEALGGNGQIKLKEFSNRTSVPTVSSSSVVIFHTRDVVFPGDYTSNLELSCFNNCPDPAKVNSSSTNFSDNWASQAKRLYSFNAKTYMLSYDANTNTDHTGDTTGDIVQTTASGSSSFGLVTGALFEWTTANKALLACDWDSGQLCPWKAYDKLSEFFTWETGPNDWNKLTTIEDPSTSKAVKFEAPLPVKYKHTAVGKHDKQFNNTTFYLEYAGFGNLNNIPSKCINQKTGIEVSCFDSVGDGVRYIPQFIIPPGAPMVGADATADDFVAKPLEVEQTMKKVADSKCTGAGLSLAGQTKGDISTWTDPALGDTPTTADAPAVIGGVVQSK